MDENPAMIFIHLRAGTTRELCTLHASASCEAPNSMPSMGVTESEVGGAKPAASYIT